MANKQGVFIIKLQYLTNCSLLMLVYLAEENRIITSRELEEKIHFPQQSVFSAGRKLKKLGFIDTVNGPFGGYRLAKPPEKISIQEILTAFKDAFYICGETPVQEASTPALQNFVKRLLSVKDEMDRQMSFTLADLLEER